MSRPTDWRADAMLRATFEASRRGYTVTRFYPIPRRLWSNRLNRRVWRWGFVEMRVR